MAQLRSASGGVMIVGITAGAAGLLEQWARTLGHRTVCFDTAARALEAARGVPFLAVLGEASLLTADPEFADRLHRRQPHTALIVVESRGSRGVGSCALEYGAVARLAAPCDRDRLEVALERAARWAAGSDACDRRSLVVRVNGRVRALDRALQRQPAVCSAELRAWLRGRAATITRQPAWMTHAIGEASRRIACAGSSSESGSLPRLVELSDVLASVVARRIHRRAGLEGSLDTFGHALALTRVVEVLGRFFDPAARWTLRRLLSATAEPSGPAHALGVDGAWPRAAA